MPLPAHILAQPNVSPTEVLSRQIRQMGLKVDVTRQGMTLTLRGLDVTPETEGAVARALRLVGTHADANRLSVDAIVYPIEENMVSRYERAGFIVQVLPMIDDEDAHTLLHRVCRQ